MVLRLGRIGDNVGGSNRRGACRVGRIGDISLEVGASRVGRKGDISMQVGASRAGRIGDNRERGGDIWGSFRWGGWDGGKVEPEVDVVHSEASRCLAEKSLSAVK